MHGTMLFNPLSWLDSSPARHWLVAWITTSRSSADGPPNLLYIEANYYLARDVEGSRIYLRNDRL
jgi:hypothetical protein